MPDFDRVPYSPIMDRPRLTWPDGARIALWVVPNIEHYEWLPREVRIRNPWPRTPHPDVLGWGVRDYGNRIGLWRLFDATDRLGIRCTVSLSLSVLQHYPEILEAMEKRNWEYMSHGMYNTRYHWGYTEEEERKVIAECCDIHERLTGRKLPGWFSPAAAQTVNTPDLCAEAGIKYYCDLYHDDQPFPLRTRAGRIVTVPYSMDINDAVMHRRPDEAAEFARQMVDCFDTMYREGEGQGQGRVMCVALHPYWIGAPHRIRHFERAMEYILGHSGVWLATGGQIADWYLAHHLGPVEAHLAQRAQRFPGAL